MENIFNLLDSETQNVITNCTNNVTYNEISNFLQLSCEDPYLMDFMVGGNEIFIFFLIFFHSDINFT